MERNEEKFVIKRIEENFKMFSEKEMKMITENKDTISKIYLIALFDLKSI